MRKFIAFVLLFACGFGLAFLPSTRVAVADEGLVYANEQQLKSIFDDFVLKNGNRHSFNLDGLEGEKNAAFYIRDELIKMGYSEEEVFVDDFSAEFEVTAGSIFSSAKTETKHSQNVVLRLGAFDSSVKKRLVIGCDYDNVFSGSGDSVGAIDNASSVATSLALAKTLFGKDLPFNVDIVFFGAGYYGYSGARAYLDLDKYLFLDIFAMINISRVAMNDIYLYSDEIVSPLEDLVFSSADFVKRMPSTVPLINVEYVEGYPYTHIGMTGNNSHFLSMGLPCVNIFGGDERLVSLGWGIAADSVENMERAYPDCYKNMARVAALLADIVFSEGLVEAAGASKSALDSPLLKPYIAYIVFGASVVVVCVVLWFVSRYYIKKYPIIRQRKVMPVFGSDYE